MYAGSAAPLYAFALFLPTIINQVLTDVADSASGSILTLIIDWLPRHSSQLTHRPRLRRRWYCNLRRWILRGSQGTTWSQWTTWHPQYVRILVLIRESGWLKLPSIFLCIGGHELKWNRKYDLTLCSRRWVHHLDVL